MDRTPSAAPASTRSLRQTARRWIVRLLMVVVVGVVLGWAQQHVVGSMIHANRQRHLAADFRTGRSLVEPGTAIAVIQIPRLAVDQVVVAGDGGDNLRSGPGLRMDSDVPGVPGVSVIAGHRRGYGAPFADVPTLIAGDSIVVQTRNLRPVDYRVVSVSPITSDARELSRFLGPLPAPATARLLLVTGGGGLLQDDLVVVVADATVPGAAEESRLEPRLAPRGRSLISRTAVGAMLAAATVALCLVVLRGRRPRWPLALCIVPVGLLTTVLGMMTIEALLAPLV